MTAAVRERPPGDRLYEEESAILASILREAMYRAQTQMALDAWAEEPSQQDAIRSLCDRDYWAYRDDYRTFRKTLPLSMMESG